MTKDRQLPVVGTPAEHVLDDTCITCGDVALPLTVVEIMGSDARCRAEDGGEELVATELVGPLVPGDRVLVHARVALERIPDTTPDTTSQTTPDDHERTTHALR